MSDPSPTRHRFKAGNTRRARLRVEVAAIRTGIVVLAHAVLIGNAIAATESAVAGRNGRLWQCLLLPLSLQTGRAYRFALRAVQLRGRDGFRIGQFIEPHQSTN